MLRCDVCGDEALDGAETCAEGHALLDPMLVLPTGAPAEDGVIRLKSAVEEMYSSQLMSEALSALAEAQVPVQPEPVPSTEVAPVAPSAVEREGVLPSAAADAADDAPSDVDPMDALLGQMDAPAEDQQRDPARVGAANAAVELFGKPGSAHRHRGRRTLIVPLILAVVLGAAGFIVLRPGTADAAVYRFAYTQGETHRYAFRMGLEGEVGAAGFSEDVKMSLSMDLTERVVGVDDRGVTTLRERIDRGTMTIDGETTRIPRATVTMKLGPDGWLLGLQGTAAMGCADADPSSQLVGPGQMYPAFPSNAVAPGDEWTVTQRMPDPFGGKDLTMTARNRLVRLGVDGAALIRSDLTMPIDWNLDVEDVRRAITRACGADAARDLRGVPTGGSLRYDGQLRMQLTQTIDRTTGRPISVLGNGAMNMSMVMEGFGQDVTVSMDMGITVSLVERDRATSA